ncbi:hypothetical protein J5N97_004350 [Dioscorea zingiberensis]|uniref:Uncharacterized protein n=1 Tax=Dioscorea zingiberensis TaxID=325984 RepID=A0A9D5D737_9LILI|nr:hypothetical protein J5N97_004350 [Dioscorea zingiberensis]
MDDKFSVRDTSSQLIVAMDPILTFKVLINSFSKPVIVLILGHMYLIMDRSSVVLLDRSPNEDFFSS